jgi:hypothetical protein
MALLGKTGEAIVQIRREKDGGLLGQVHICIHIHNFILSIPDLRDRCDVVELGDRTAWILEPDAKPVKLKHY